MKRFVLTLLFLCLSTLAVNATALFAVCTVTCTWDNSSTAMWSTSSGGATGAGPPGASDTVTLDAATCVGGVTCTITPNANITIISLTMGACTATTTGCVLDFSVNNNNITFSSNNAFVGQGSGKRVLNMGNGTWTLNSSGGGNAWRLDTTTNLTFNANGSTLKFANNNLSFAGMASNTLTYNKIEIAGTTNLNTSSITIGTLQLDATSLLSLNNNTTYTVTTAFVISGASTSAQVGIGSTNPGSTAAVLVLPASTTAQWVSLRDVNFVGSGSTPVFSNSFNVGNVLNATVTAPGAGGSGGCILGGWLLWRDMPNNLNDNFPAWLDKAA